MSFAQLRGISIALRGLPLEVDAELDVVLTALLEGLQAMERPDPDVLVRQVADAADELDAAGLALLDAATAPPAALLDQPGGVGGARVDTLLARLAGTGPEATGAGHTDLEHTDPEHIDPEDAAVRPDGEGLAPWQQRLGPPKLLLRLSFDALLDERVPADLLTRLVGGRLRLTSAAARDLADRRGALLRTIVVDDQGAVIGVGRSTRRPPGWLRDAITAIHDTCTEPGCDRPARGADHDHARPWWPTGPDQQAGTTDVTEVGPLCPASDRDKEAVGWKVRQTAAGVRTWHHPRSGLATTTPPRSGRPRRGRWPDAPCTTTGAPGATGSTGSAVLTRPVLTVAPTPLGLVATADQGAAGRVRAPARHRHEVAVPCPSWSPERTVPSRAASRWRCSSSAARCAPTAPAICTR